MHYNGLTACNEVLIQVGGLELLSLGARLCSGVCPSVPLSQFPNIYAAKECNLAIIYIFLFRASNKFPDYLTQSRLGHVNVYVEFWWGNLEHVHFEN